ncbi:uncharacterized protein LOC143298219 [Babylonia areolata]|uniref:uncharacterized protein LOC143298219 n=1 Tax=Babylonia areolata TaxID=304850 RepID=UPI003FD659B4
MRAKTLCMILVVLAVALLASDPVEGWRRLRIRIRGRRVWRFLGRAAVKYGLKTLGAAALGKRGAEAAEGAEGAEGVTDLTEDQVEQLAQELENDCSQLPDLTKAVVGQVFDDADLDMNNTLKGEELSDFVEKIAFFEECAEVENSRK